MKKLILTVLVGLTLTISSAFAVCDPLNTAVLCIETTTNIPKPDTTNQYNKLEAALSASSSVELNPNHEGFSMALGIATTKSNELGGAVGIMWGFGISAFHLKAYKASEQISGVSAGITLNF